MKKSFFSFILTIIFIFSLNLVSFADNGYNPKVYNVSQVNSINYVSAVINNDTLDLVIQNVSNKNRCLVSINDVKKSYELGKNNCFYANFPLSNFNDGVYILNIYLGNKGDETFWTFLRRDIKLVRQNGEWFFLRENLYDKNKQISDSTKNSNLLKILPVSNIVREYSNNIVGSSKSVEEKVSKIYKWIVENIAYDYDNYYANRSSYNIPDFVLQEKKAVCYGISLTFQALCYAQGIPCIVYSGQGYDSDSNTYGSHAWNEVFINNEWLVFDVTADTYFEVLNGIRQERKHNNGIYYHSFMDMNGASESLLYDGLDDKQLSISEFISKSICSDWAKGDIVNSLYSRILNEEKIGDLTKPITRAEFCDFLQYYLWYQFYDDGTFDYTQEQVEYLLWKGQTQFYYPFRDDGAGYKSSIYVCYNAGIVNGKSETDFAPYDYITREEAATILARTVDFISKQDGLFYRSYNTSKRFSDDYQVSNWAKDSVSIINDMGIMNGVGNNCFDPKGYYTVEQTISTLYRLYKYNYRR